MELDYVRVKILAHADKTMLTETKPENNQQAEV
jgi:hypothetical protein